MIYGEFLDGELVSEKDPGFSTYDGLVRESPVADFNYDMSKYSFRQPGKHELQWKGAGHPFQGPLSLESNIIHLTIEMPNPPSNGA